MVFVSAITAFMQQPVTRLRYPTSLLLIDARIRLDELAH